MIEYLSCLLRALLYVWNIATKTNTCIWGITTRGRQWQSYTTDPTRPELRRCSCRYGVLFFFHVFNTHESRKSPIGMSLSMWLKKPSSLAISNTSNEVHRKPRNGAEWNPINTAVTWAVYPGGFGRRSLDGLGVVTFGYITSASWCRITPKPLSQYRAIKPQGQAFKSFRTVVSSVCQAESSVKLNCVIWEKVLPYTQVLSQPILTALLLQLLFVWNCW